MSSRDINDLDPIIQSKCRAHIAACAQENIDLLITCTYRTADEQQALYNQGRTKPGPIVTNAKPGQSMHQYRLAYDVVPLRNGKPVWDTTGEDGVLWQKVGAAGKAQGLEWGEDWVGFKEMPHFQFTGGKPLSFFQGGGKL
jgi:peptidoglycan LD-endopeptidase CwlK